MVIKAMASDGLGKPEFVAVGSRSFKTRPLDIMKRPGGLGDD